MVYSPAVMLAAILFSAWTAPWSVNAVEPVTPEAAIVERAATPAPPPMTSLPVIVLRAMVRGYQLGISPADGASCSMYPTCSGYAMLCLRKHGAVKGFVMTSDRVMRNHGGPQYPPIEKYGIWRFHDPVEANDYWFAAVKRERLDAIRRRHETALAQRAAAGIP